MTQTWIIPVTSKDYTLLDNNGIKLFPEQIK